MKKNLPKISIITPSFNQVNFIEQTIQSILSQNYPNLEYLVIDGGSTDGSADVIKKYQKKIDWFVSEKDRGQSHALNKGLKRATGDIIAFINSDDYYLPHTLQKVGDFFLEHPRADWLTGKCLIVDNKGKEIRKLVTGYKNFFLKHARNNNIFRIIQFISQPATFWRRKVTEKVGLFDETYDYSMDYDYWLRVWKEYKPYFLDEYLAVYRVHPESKAVKSTKYQFRTEEQILHKYETSSVIKTLHHLHLKLALFLYRRFFL